MVAAIPVEVPAGTPVVADRGSDGDARRDDVADDGFRFLAPRRRNRHRPSRSDGRRMRRSVRRSVAERTFGWQPGDRRSLVRHAYDAHLYDGLLHLARATIATGKLGNRF